MCHTAVRVTAYLAAFRGTASYGSRSVHGSWAAFIEDTDDDEPPAAAPSVAPAPHVTAATERVCWTFIEEAAEEVERTRAAPSEAASALAAERQQQEVDATSRRADLDARAADLDARAADLDAREAAIYGQGSVDRAACAADLDARKAVLDAREADINATLNAGARQRDRLDADARAARERADELAAHLAAQRDVEAAKAGARLDVEAEDVRRHLAGSCGGGCLTCGSLSIQGDLCGPPLPLARATQHEEEDVLPVRHRPSRPPWAPPHRIASDHRAALQQLPPRDAGRRRSAMTSP